MIAVLGGLGAAVAWTVTALAATQASRRIGVASTLAWVMLVGLAVVAPAAALEGLPAELDSAAAGWLVLAGAGNVLGLGLEYAGLRAGKVGLVIPIVSTEGAIAAAFAVVAGEHLSPPLAAALATVTVGVILTSATRGGEGGHRVRATAFAVGSALAFGASLYAAGRVAAELPIAWVALPARAIGVLVLVIPLAVVSSLRLPHGAAPLVVAAGLCEVLGIAAFVVGARDEIAVAAVLASQFAALAVLAAFFLFHERLTRLQAAGVAAIAVGVAAAALQSA
jgi:drug/metabolite transporter (DMT)-like permease